MLIRAGDVVPADLRLTVGGRGCAIDRSILTGESHAGAGDGRAGSRRCADRRPPVDGVRRDERRARRRRGHRRRDRAGDGDRDRSPRALAGEERRRSPLQRELDRLVRILLVVAIGLIVITVGSGFVRGNPPGANLLAGISAAIAAIPEEPPILLAVILGLGALPAAQAWRARAPAQRRGDARRGRPDPDRQDRDADPEPARARRRAVPDADATAGRRRAGGATAAILGEALRAEDDAWRAAGSGAAPGSFSRAIAAAIDEPTATAALDPADLVAADPLERTVTVATRDLAPRRRRRRSSRRSERRRRSSRWPASTASAATPGTTLVDGEAATGRRLLLLAVRDGLTGDGALAPAGALLRSPTRSATGVREAPC